MRRVVAERLAGEQTVVLVESAISVLRARRIPDFEERIRPLNSAYSWRYIPLHFPEKLPGIGRLARLLNQHLLGHELDRLLPPTTPRIICYDSPSQHNLVKRLREHISIYLAIDDRTLTVTGKSIKGDLDAEQRLLRQVDKVICVSDRLAQTLRLRMSSASRKPVHVLGNGYDERVFDPQRNYPEPEALKGVPKPRILVAGYVSQRIDWETIRQASLLRPQWTWVFLGPVEPGSKDRLDSMGGQAFWHPRVALTDVPAWISHSDACAVPYHLNAFTLASHPLKAIEYLAMGIPVVSTRVPSLLQYGDALMWVDEGDPQAYVSALDRCITESADPQRREQRRRAVEKASWHYGMNQFKKTVFSESA